MDLDDKVVIVCEPTMKIIPARLRPLRNAVGNVSNYLYSEYQLRTPFDLSGLPWDDVDLANLERLKAEKTGNDITSVDYCHQCMYALNRFDDTTKYEDWVPRSSEHLVVDILRRCAASDDDTMRKLATTALEAFEQLQHDRQNAAQLFEIEDLARIKEPRVVSIRQTGENACVYDILRLTPPEFLAWCTTPDTCVESL